jgi:hypothetical protein
VENQHVDEARTDRLFVLHDEYLYLPLHPTLKLTPPTCPGSAAV